MKVDFSNICIEAIDGSLFPADEVNTARQQLCNRIYSSAKDIPLMELAQKLYHADGVVEMTDGEVQMWRKELESVPAFIRKGFLAALEEKR